jgi:hypothetical protein
MIIAILFLFAQSELFEPQNVLKFADHLFAQQDYMAALSEYRRYLFLGDSAVEYIHERIVECLTQLRRYNEAVIESANIKDTNRRNYTKGLIYFVAGSVDSSRTYLQQVDVPYEKDARRMIGLGYAYEFEFDEASDYITLPKNKPSYKKPALGALFSLFPGGGHLYAGRLGDGLYSFLIVSTAALLTYYYYDRDEDVKFGFALGAAILLYGGNIYGGVNAVRNYNYYENEKCLQQILQNQ